MVLSLRPQHVGRYRDIARLLVKYGRSDLVRQAGLEELGGGDGAVVPAAPAAPARAEELADQLAGDLERLGPTYVKLGQLLSTRADLIPAAYARSLRRLQDSVEPFDYEEVERIVERELGFRIAKGFSSFDPEPLASASLGQVHRARMRDGREVVVKVQRPGIRDQVAADMEALAELAHFADAHVEAGRRYGFADLLEEFRRSLGNELDYRREAAHLATLGRI
ncbi:MAG TPA: AarF/UbiB family protein, partial [Acidimicrobiales bacterium]|nr:AarF/UbiB family protein [Acidimicrobiales bacterium]